MIIYLPVQRPFSFKPFIVMPKWMKNVDRKEVIIQKEATIVHETTHYNRQSFFPIFWVSKYFLNKKFRLQEETLAYKKTIEIYSKYYPNDNYIIYLNDHYAHVMSEEYWGMCTYQEALEALK